MGDFYEDFNPFYESNDYLMSDSEEDEPAPEPSPRSRRSCRRKGRRAEAAQAGTWLWRSPPVWT